MTMLCLLLFGWIVAEDPAPLPQARGCLVIEGGGESSVEVRKLYLNLAGGEACQVVVIPQASLLADSGPIAAQRWRALGARNVAILDLEDPAGALAMIAKADFIWICGGEQERLMSRLEGTGLPEAIRSRYRDGATVGGTSAGAAVMSRTMIARSVEDYPLPRANEPILAEGLGLWPEVIVDQHFLTLKRLDRLQYAVAEHPDHIGVGIDESTAVIVRGRTFEVVGRSRVTIVDPRQNVAEVVPAGHSADEGGGDGLPPPPAPIVSRVSTLNPGMTYDLDRGMILNSIAEKR